MDLLPDILVNAVDSIAKLPGVGKKSAMRIVLNLTKWDSPQLESFTNSISKISELSSCQQCGMFCEDKFCSICLSDKRQSSCLCIVENITDLMAIENSGQYRGRYLVLGGVLNPLMGIGPDQLNFSTLKERVSTNNIEEIILALSPSVEGDATCAYIKQLIPTEVSVQRIGFGVPIGGSLEYLDPLTISKAFENKRVL